MARRLRILVCHHYIKETRAVLKACGWGDVKVGGYPARCVTPCAMLSEEEREALKAFSHRPADEDLIIVGFCCVGRAGGVLDVLSPTEVYLLDSCFSLFVNSNWLRRLQGEGAYLLTPGWLDQWRRRIDEWGFDQQTAREFFRESASRFVLLDTGVSPRSGEEFVAFCDFLGLPGETHDVGLEIMEQQVQKAVLEWRLKCLEKETADASSRTDALVAQQAMAFDLLAELTRTMGEDEAVDKILEIFSMLTGAGCVDYVRGIGDRTRRIRTTRSAPVVWEEVAGCLQALRPEDGYAMFSGGFALRVSFRDDPLGVLLVRDLPLPERTTDYLNLGLSIVNLCGLAISNARTETARRRAEQELVTKARELERSNADLTQFAYVVSHDLQEPLRTVVGFLGLLKRKYGAGLDEGAHNYIQQAVDGTERMDRFIQDLLQYSRAGTRAVTLLPVDLNEVVEQVRLGLHAAIEEAGAALEVPEPLPSVLGHGGLLGQLLQNLLSNAIKFRGDASPVVRITAERNDEGWQLSICDNGIGFDPRDSERIFRIFQRLRTTREFKGTGIGLAVCRRIVERHGGKIWAESQPGVGTTFHFTLLPATALKQG